MDLIESYSKELKLIRKPWTKVIIGILLITLILLPLFSPEYVIYILTLIFIYSIGIQGQNILIGYTGQISFGQSAFLIIGAFTFGHLVRAGVPWPVCIFMSGLLAGLAGMIVGIPSLRLKGPYLAIATLGFGIAVYQIFASSELLSGGRMGLIVKKLAPPFGLTQMNFNYYFNFLFALVLSIISYNIISSYIGRAFIAIRDNDIAAEVMGVNVTYYKLLSFAISSFYTGIHGGLFALLLGYLEPNMFTYMEAIHIFVAVIIGGLASIGGSCMGAAFIVLVPQLVSSYQGMVPIVFGATLIIVLLFEQHGLNGIWIRIRLYFKNWPFR